MTVIRTFRAEEFAPARLVEAKGDQRISVCLPARDEEATVGEVVTVIRTALVDDLGLVDEVLVLDDHSSDATAAVAASAGARVVSAGDVLASHDTGPGKGGALWRSLAAAEGDLVVWCDADIVDLDPRFVTGLLGPLLTRPDLMLTKGFYERPVRPDGLGGGRVTELVARPLIALLFPHLAPIVQPLSGEYAGRREALEQLAFASGYGVDLGLLIDAADRFGTDALAQVDLGVRVHRNRPLHELGPQALEVMQAALDRADPALLDEAATLVRPGLEPVVTPLRSHPPLAGLPGRRRTTA